MWTRCFSHPCFKRGRLLRIMLVLVEKKKKKSAPGRLLRAWRNASNSNTTILWPKRATPIVALFCYQYHHPTGVGGRVEGVNHTMCQNASAPAIVNEHQGDCCRASPAVRETHIKITCQRRHRVASRRSVHESRFLSPDRMRYSQSSELLLPSYCLQNSNPADDCQRRQFVLVRTIRGCLASLVECPIGAVECARASPSRSSMPSNCIRPFKL